MKKDFLKVLEKGMRICVLLWILLSFPSCDKKNSPNELETQQPLDEQQRLEKIMEAKRDAISDYAASLSPEARISQLFLVNIEGNERYTAVENASLLGRRTETPLVPGGVLLFSYNISKDPLETYEFIKSIHDFYVASENPPPYVAVDQEGGDVNRLRGLTSVLWSQKKVAESFSIEGAAQLYSAQARQMRNLGFHLNLAPVAEVETDANREFLDTRTFGSIENISAYGKTSVAGYEANNIATVLKHFPGNSSTDPHTGLPEISVTRAELESNYLAPFRILLSGSSAVLMSHARVAVTDDESYTESKTPACLSKYWVTDILRSELGFDGLVLSDDIFMGALAKNGFPPETACVRAIEAGIDVIMLSEKRFGGVAAILREKANGDADFASKINHAVENVIRFKIKSGILELNEIDEDLDDSRTEKSQNEGKIPRFVVREKPSYEEFDLYRFDEDYKSGMKAYDMGK